MPPADTSRAFHAILRCMSEGRAPHAREIEQVAEKIWNESYRRRAKLNWSDVAIGSPDERRSLAAARAALGVPPSFWAEIAKAA